MPAGVVSWKQCLSDNQAWDTLTWFAALIAMAAYLNKYGFITWFSDKVRACCFVHSSSVSDQDRLGICPGRQPLMQGCTVNGTVHRAATPGQVGFGPCRALCHQDVHFNASKHHTPFGLPGQVVGLVGGLGLSWQATFGVILTLYFYSHYFFASGEQSRYGLSRVLIERGPRFPGSGRRHWDLHAHCRLSPASPMCACATFFTFSQPALTMAAIPNCRRSPRRRHLHRWSAMSSL